MVSIVYIDDEPECLEYFKSLTVNNFPDRLSLHDIYSDAKSALDGIQPDKVDIAFVDINLGEDNGLELGKRLQYLGIMVVYITGHLEKSMAAYERNSQFLILKPMRVIDLEDILFKFHRIFKPLSLGGSFSSGSQHRETTPAYTDSSSDRIVVNTSDKFSVVKFDQLEFVSSFEQLSTFHLLGDEKVTSSKPIGYYQKKLSQFPFFRCHRSYIVNVKEIKNIRKGKFTDQIVLKSGKLIPVASLRRSELKKFLRDSSVSQP